MGYFKGPNKRRPLRSTMRRGVPLMLLCGIVAGCSADVTRFGGGPIYTGSTPNQKSILGVGEDVAPAPQTAQYQNPLDGQPVGQPVGIETNQSAAAPAAASASAAISQPAISSPATSLPAAPRVATSSGLSAPAIAPLPAAAPLPATAPRLAASTAAPLPRPLAPSSSVPSSVPRRQPTFAEISSNATSRLPTPQDAAPLGAPSGQELAAAGRLPSLAAGQQVDQISTGSTGPQATAPQVAMASYKGWHSAGGTTITLLRGDSLATLSERYAIPQDVLAGVNGMNPNASLLPGQRFVIPVYGTDPAAGAASAPQALTSKRLIPAASVQQAATKVQPLRAPFQAIPQARPSRVAALARSKSDVTSTTNGTVTKSVAVPRPAVRPTATQSAIQSASTGSAAALATSSPGRLQSAPLSQPNGLSASPSQTFRWPAKGPVVAGFGDALGDRVNDGINISLPQGASIRAADDGEVIYAGDGIRNFGNLVLLSHANGYVTAYAHADEIAVQRGDRVSRGQIIAAAGSSGSVSEPQLHFEVRKGSSPIDPAPYLSNQ